MRLIKKKAAKTSSKKPDKSKKTNLLNNSSKFSKEVSKLKEKLYDQQLQMDLQSDELQKNQAELEFAQHKFYNLFDYSPTGYINLDNNFKILEINLAAAKLLNIEKKSLIKKSFSQLVDPVYYDLFQFYIERIKSSGIKEQFEIKLKRKSSNSFWALIECSVGYEYENLESVSITITDITERKLAELELEKKEKELRSILNNSNDLIIRFDRDFRLLIANPVLEKMIGISCAEAVGKTIIELGFQEEKLKRLKQHFNKVFNSGQPDEFEFTLNRIDNPRYFHATIAPEFGSDGLVATILAIVRDITARKKREDELHRTKDYLENLFNYSNAPIITWNFNQEIKQFNHAFEKMTGYTSAEVLGKKLSILFPENSREESLRKIKNTLTEKWEVVEIPILRKDGEIRIALWNSANVYDKEGKNLEATIAQGQDITERINTEQALVKSKEQLNKTYALLESVTHSTKVIISSINKDYRLTYFNDEHHKELKRLTGKETYLGMSLKELFADIPEEMEKALSIWNQAMKGEIVVRTIEFGDPSIYRRWYSTRHAPIYDSDNNIIGAGEVTTEITEFIKMQEALRESELKYRTIVETANEGILTGSLDGKITYLNKRMADMLGYTVDEVIGKVGTDFAYLDQQSQVLQSRQKLHKGEFLSGEIKFRKKDGTPLWSMFNSAPIFNEKGEHIANIAMHTDITHRKKMEDQLKKDLNALTRIHEISEHKIINDNLQPLLQEIMDAAVDVMNADKGTLQIIEGESLKIVAQHNHQEPFLEFFKNAESKTSVCGEVMQVGQRVIVEDVETSDLFAGTSSLPVLRDAGVRAVQSSPMLSTNGKLMGILTTHWNVPYLPDEHDLWRIDLLASQAAGIIEYTEAELALRKSESKYRTIVETANEGIVTISLQGYYLYANQRMADMLGYKVDELIGKSGLNFIVQEHHKNVEDTRHALHKGESISGEIEFRRKDGSKLISMFSTSPIFDEKGEHIANIAMHTDITERKKAEDALKKLNEELEERVLQRTLEVTNERKRLYEVLETLPAMICLLTPDYHTIFANRSFREKFGESNGRCCYEYCYGKNEPCSFCESFTVFKTGKPHHWEVNTPDGYVISAHDYPFTDVNGSPLILEMDIDITEQRNNELELKKHRENLEQLVEDRSAEIISINEELTRFNKAAVGRELRMIELKKEVNELSIRLNQQPPYSLEFEEEKK